MEVKMPEKLWKAHLEAQAVSEAIKKKFGKALLLNFYCKRQDNCNLLFCIVDGNICPYLVATRGEKCK